MTQNRRLRVMIADDNQLARLGIKTLLMTDDRIEVVEMVASGGAVLERYPVCRPDVLVLDLKMPDLDGARVTAQLRALDPGARILVLSQLEGDLAIHQVLQAGALGYVTKESGGDEILRGIAAVAAGQRFLPAAITARLAVEQDVRALSPREREVLQWLARGLSNREIASVLSISERTVNVHVTHLFEKLGASNRTEAVSLARDSGLVDS